MPAKEKSFLGRNLYSFWDGDVDRKKAIASYKRPVRVEGSRVMFECGGECQVDEIIWCTGYKVEVPFLDDVLDGAHGGGGGGGGVEQMEMGRRGGARSERKIGGAKRGGREERGNGKRRGGAGSGAPRQGAASSSSSSSALPDLRNISFSGEPRLSFLGFVRPNVGAIPPMAELQTMWWIQHMRNKLHYPLRAPRYRLRGRNARTESYAVDYGCKTATEIEMKTEMR